MLKNRLTHFAVFMLIGFLGVESRPVWAAEDDAKEWDGCYADGVKLYNQNRLGEAFDNFECAKQKKQNAKESEGYLLQIRQDVVKTGKKNADERAKLNYGGNQPDSALSVQHVEKGFMRVTLQAKYLFDENTSALKAGAMDVIDQAAALLTSKERNRIEFTIVDDLDTTPTMKDIDAERALTVFSLLNFTRLATPTS